MGLSGGVPNRVDAATKTALLHLLDEAVTAGFTLRRACGELDLSEVRAHRWIARRAAAQLDDRAPGGSPLHGLLDAEAAQILALFDQWGETDRSHRKLAHRGSYVGQVWVSPSSVRRVLFLADKHFRPQPRPGPSRRRPFPEWVHYTPNSIWIYDTTHFARAGMAVLIIQDLVSRKWITEVVSAEETSTQVEIGFTDALHAEGLLEAVEQRADGLVDVDDQARPILLAVSDNGPQMTSGSTREFMAMCAIAQHFGRPGTPTDQAWIESFNGHLKREYPHLLAIEDPATLRGELAHIRERWNGVRLHAGIGYVTPNDEHEGRGEAIRQARRDGLQRARQLRLAYHRQNRHTQPTQDPHDVV
ncbi:MAG: DDE-type integrase/transposase/recombinase [Gammaproteobacteria bacterium]|nr:DDE-type integrase/transposase/recombinase [Gammaproteobacteria bacterium]